MSFCTIIFVYRTLSTLYLYWPFSSLARACCIARMIWVAADSGSANNDMMGGTPPSFNIIFLALLSFFPPCIGSVSSLKLSRGDIWSESGGACATYASSSQSFPSSCMRPCSNSDSRYSDAFQAACADHRLATQYQEIYKQDLRTLVM